MIDLKPIKDRVARATPGKWELWTGCSWRRFGIIGGIRPFIEPVVSSDGHPDMIIKEGDSEFIAHSKSDIFSLISEVEKLRSTAQQAEKEGYLRGVREAKGLVEELNHAFNRDHSEHAFTKGDDREKCSMRVCIGYRTILAQHKKKTEEK